MKWKKHYNFKVHDTDPYRADRPTHLLCDEDGTILALVRTDGGGYWAVNRFDTLKSIGKWSPRLRDAKAYAVAYFSDSEEKRKHDAWEKMLRWCAEVRASAAVLS